MMLKLYVIGKTNSTTPDDILEGVYTTWTGALDAKRELP